eukprot:sb/3467980/
MEDLCKWTGEEGENIQPVYLAHFQNWGEKYDRWVAEDLILPITPENLISKEQLENQLGSPKAPGHTRRTPSSTQPTPSTTNSRRSSKPVMIKLNLPDTIKQSLERDFVNITLRNQVVCLPRSPNVASILSSFTTSRPDDEGAEEFCTEIRTMFNVTLPLQLLYKEERTQYEQEGFVLNSRSKRQQLLTPISEKEALLFPGYSHWGDKEAGTNGPKEAVLLYGVEHLLRLFVKLSELTAHLETPYRSGVRHYGQMFLDWIAEHRAEVFVEVQPYRNAI